jgi:hypothetical protein
MWTCFSLALGLAVFLPTIGLSEAAASEVGDAVMRPAEEILSVAFANRYDCDLRAEIELRMRNRSGSERRRLVKAAVKRIGGRLHSVGRLVSPQYLKGMTVMSIENQDRSDDSFVYLPSLGRVRRITTAQRADSFLGSDLTYRDLERQRLEDYEIGTVQTQRVGEEPAFLVRAHPLKDPAYDHLDFLVAKRDSAILEVRYFKRGGEAPSRLIQAPRESMIVLTGHVLPTRLVVGNPIRGTSTEVIFRNLVVNPPIDDREFSLGALERGYGTSQQAH